ncbi:MAG: FAD-dependent oxidoreductase, partial [Pseudonocardiaceae bacterium]
MSGQATRAAGAMLSTFSEIEPRHDAQHTAVQTAERLAAHAMYSTWLERITHDSGIHLRAEPGTWVLAPAGRRGHLESIAAAARAAGHPAQLHDPAQIPGLNPPPTSAGALWLPTEARIDSAALMDALTRSVQAHPRSTWHDASAESVTADRVSCVDGTEVHAQQVVLAAGTSIPGLLPHGGRALGVPPILAGRGVSMLLH